ncbi:tRNA pseudouridine(13) synthase TruD [Marinobacter zhejiangensis]|uniref:tRNA pseudouridine synthase D n=1 Tax=Marinobacter zhejiangensis TaxID=488535 RepID=A0A1I4RAH1_9GAMM|nr:tRNA pseudouridine(13) synthase TruD [Marinobacter zhejiangensis]SFM49288.1 tRNA pseudouridine13 synthase [Marinobacter zhejiangensis]
MSEQQRWRLDWPVPAPGRVAKAVLKASPETFFVDEDLGQEGFPEEITSADALVVGGDGEHVCLRLEKTGDNTDYVARQLASLAGCRHHDVGYCGLKDRHAVTRQWFSLYRPGQEASDQTLIEQVSQRWPVLSAHRHARKLRRGDHRGNAFMITLVDVEGDREAIDSALHQVALQGCPNYYGRQRFGHDGGNLDRAIALDFSRPRHRGRRGQSSRNRDGMYFSAARSWLFNEVLAERVEVGNWLERFEGEPDPVAPTGPLWGDGGTTATGDQETLERRVVAEHPELAQVFSSTRMKPERRALALMPGALAWEWRDQHTLILRFHLLPGQFATSLIGSVFELTDAGGGDSGVAEDR